MRPGPAQVVPCECAMREETCCLVVTVFIVEDSWKKGKEGKEGRKKFYSLPPLSSCFLYIIVLVHTCSPLPLSSVFPLFTMLFFPVSNPSPFPSLYFVLTILNLSILHSSLFYSAYAFWLHHSRTQAHNTIIIRIYIPHPTPTQPKPYHPIFAAFCVVS